MTCTGTAISCPKKVLSARRRALLHVGTHPCGRLGVEHALQTIAYGVGSYKEQRRGVPEVQTTNGRVRETNWMGAIHVA